MTAGQVSDLVREDGVELLRIERIQERHAQHEVVVVPAEQSETGNLRDPGIEFLVHDDAMQARRARGTPQTLDALEQRRRFHARQGDAGRRRNVHDQRPEDEPDEWRQYQHELDAERFQVHHRHQRADERGEEAQHEQGEIRVAEERERHHAEPVTARMGRSRTFQAGDASFELLAGHRHGILPRRRSWISRTWPLRGKILPGGVC